MKGLIDWLFSSVSQKVSHNLEYWRRGHRATMTRFWLRNDKVCCKVQGCDVKPQKKPRIKSENLVSGTSSAILVHYPHLMISTSKPQLIDAPWAARSVSKIIENFRPIEARLSAYESFYHFTSLIRVCFICLLIFIEKSHSFFFFFFFFQNSPRRIYNIASCFFLLARLIYWLMFSPSSAISDHMAPSLDLLVPQF